MRLRIRTNSDEDFTVSKRNDTFSLARKQQRFIDSPRNADADQNF